MDKFDRQITRTNDYPLADADAAIGLRQMRRYTLSTKKNNTDLTLEEESEQMSLFQIIEPHTADNRYSNTIEIYDALPKYNWQHSREYTLEDAEFKRSCTINRIEYNITVRPALITRAGRSVLVYPSLREELVEDALRKLAVSGQGKMMDNNAGVLFTLYQLQQELKSSGHGFDLTEIKEAILVCRGATLECHSKNGDAVVSSSFFTTIGLTSKEDWLEKRTDARCFVMFNPLVTKSIMELTFRPYNYSIGMSLNSPLARFIYKKMSHHWTQASPTDPYTPSLVSFLTQSPRGLSPRMPENVRAMKNALALLVKAQVIDHYTTDVIKKGSAITDVRYVIYPHQRFVNDVMSANKAKNSLRAKALKNSLNTPKAVI